MSALCLLIAWQLVAGWPLHRNVAVRLRTEGTEPELVTGTIRTAEPPLEWNSPWSRIWVNDREIPRFHSRKDMLALTAIGCVVIGRSVYLRLADRPAERAVRAQVSWQPSWIASASWGLLFILLSALLVGVRHPWLSRGCDLMGRLPIAASLLGLVLATALLLRGAGYSAPMWHPDSDGFLAPAMDLAAGQPMRVTDRPLGYSVVVALALRWWADLRAIVVLHQVSSLVFAVALGWTLFAASRRLFPAGRSHWIASACAVLATALWGWDERILRRENHLIPEALVPGYLGLQIWLLWRLTACDLPRGRRLLEYALFCAAGWLAYYTKPNWSLAVALLPAPWIAHALMRRSSWRSFWRCTIAGLGVCLLVSVGALACQFLTPANTQAALAIRYRVFVCWHLDMVRARFRASLPPSRTPKSARSWVVSKTWQNSSVTGSGVMLHF